MLHLPTLHNEIVGIAYTPTTITCSWIKAVPSTSVYTLMAYRRTTLDPAIIHRSFLFNPTIIRQHIAAFIQAHNLTQAYVLFSLSGPGIIHDFIPQVTSQPQPHDISLTGLTKAAWDMQYLYQHDNGAYVFYICGMKRELIAQYALLAATTHLNLIAITTHFIPLLRVYYHTHGAAFRHTQLAADMQLSNNQLERIITADSIRRVLRIVPTNNFSLDHELPFLINALGLFLLGSNNHEKDEFHQLNFTA
jgi:hypothetical protein